MATTAHAAQMMLMQLMQGPQLSGTTALGAMGMDWRSEQRTLGEEARYQQEAQARLQEEMAQAGFAGPAGQGPARSQRWSRGAGQAAGQQGQ